MRNSQVAVPASTGVTLESWTHGEQNSDVQTKQDGHGGEHPSRIRESGDSCNAASECEYDDDAGEARKVSLAKEIPAAGDASPQILRVVQSGVPVEDHFTARWLQQYFCRASLKIDLEAPEPAA